MTERLLAAQSADRIFLEGIECIAYGGVSRAEQTVGQRYQIDITLETDASSAGVSDSLHDTLDYSSVYSLVVQVMITGKFHTIEFRAHQIAAAILSQTLATAVTVKVRKLNPPLPGIVAAAGVEIHRSRN